MRIGIRSGDALTIGQSLVFLWEEARETECREYSESSMSDRHYFNTVRWPICDAVANNSSASDAHREKRELPERELLRAKTKPAIFALTLSFAVIPCVLFSVTVFGCAPADRVVLNPTPVAIERAELAKGNAAIFEGDHLDLQMSVVNISDSAAVIVSRHSSCACTGIYNLDGSELQLPMSVSVGAVVPLKVRFQAPVSQAGLLNTNVSSTVTMRVSQGSHRWSLSENFKFTIKKHAVVVPETILFSLQDQRAGIAKEVTLLRSGTALGPIRSVRIEPDGFISVAVFESGSKPTETNDTVTNLQISADSQSEVNQSIRCVIDVEGIASPVSFTVKLDGVHKVSRADPSRIRIRRNRLSNATRKIMISGALASCEIDVRADDHCPCRIVEQERVGDRRVLTLQFDADASRFLLPAYDLEFFADGISLPFRVILE